MLFVGAGTTVAVTALWLAFTDQPARSKEWTRTILSVPPAVARGLRTSIRGVFLAGVVVALLIGVIGRQVAAENVATIFTWPLWFRGVALIAILLGNPWQTLSPWRTIYSGLVWIEGRTFSVRGKYPSVLSEWPAVVGFVLLIGIVENLTTIPRSPRLTSGIIAVYAVTMIGGVSLYGTKWLHRADPLGVFYRLFGRVSAIVFSKHDDGGYIITLRPPWQGCLDPLRSVPLVIFVLATIYTVSFDGFTGTRLYQSILFGGRESLGTGSGTSVILYAGGFAGFVITFGFISWIVERFGAGTGRDWVTTARWFAPTVIPIAAAYEVAHNYPYVLRNLGQLIVVVAQFIGLNVESVRFLGWLSLPAFWGSQVVLIVLGHVIAVVAAHSVSHRRYDSPTAVRRGHLPLVALMVGYTVLSLWIISQPVVTA
jgi:hypothetical protein